MPEHNVNTDLTFFTNEPDSTLLDRFVAILKDMAIFHLFLFLHKITDAIRIWKAWMRLKKYGLLRGWINNSPARPQGTGRYCVRCAGVNGRGAQGGLLGRGRIGEEPAG